MERISASDILLFPAILMFFGAFVYGVAYFNGMRDHVLPRFRWVGAALLVLAAFIGARFVYKLYEPGIGPFYQAQLQSRKVVAAHYASLVLPLLLIVAAIVMEGYFKRYRRDMD